MPLPLCSSSQSVIAKQQSLPERPSRPHSSTEPDGEPASPRLKKPAAVERAIDIQGIKEINLACLLLPVIPYQALFSY
jgi:hypothetical protein